MSNSLFQFEDGLLRHLFVNVPVPGEGFGVLHVSGNLGDQIRVLDLFVKIADEYPAGHMRGGDLPDRVLLFFPGEGIDTESNNHLSNKYN